MEDKMIEGVMLKELMTHADDRGYFREIIRSTDEIFPEGFGQWSHSLMFNGVIKAWHYHNIQTDWFYVVHGVLRIGLHDLRSGSPTKGETMDFLMGDLQPASVVKIPPGVAHGCKVIQGPASLLYITSHIYNSSDEIRIPYDDEKIGFDWLSGPPIK
jgi:dTDP-4-dehydrorhamnose 3,5-epimerase